MLGLSLGLGLKANLSGLGLEAQVLGLGIAVQGLGPYHPRPWRWPCIPCGLVNITADRYDPEIENISSIFPASDTAFRPLLHMLSTLG